MTAAIGALLILGATILSVSSCSPSARSAPRPTGVRTLVRLLGATALACAGASLIATVAGTVPTVLAFAVGAVGVSAPVVLGVAAGPHTGRSDRR